MEKESRDPEICIVGGGLSGLATAFYLQQQPELRHANIRLIEKQQRLGGNFIKTSHADAAVLHALLSAPRNQQYFYKGGCGISSKECSAAPPDEFVSMAQKIVQDRVVYRHLSVTPAALQQPGPPSSIRSFARPNGSQKFVSEDGRISMEFGAGVPHLLAPGGSHVLRLINQLLMPSQLLIARRQAASVFSLLRSAKASLSGPNWLPSLWGHTQQAANPQGLSRCKPGLSRLLIAQALLAGFRESFLIKRKKKAFQNWRSGESVETQAAPGAASCASVDISVSSFAELHSSKALAKGLLLPAFSACSYAGEAGRLSASSYFPRAWLLQQHYGSLLRGTWAERRAAFERQYEHKGTKDLRSSCGSTEGGSSQASGSSPASDGSSQSGARIFPVKGCKARPQDPETIHRVTSEGAGVFAPVGGMRQVTDALERHILKPSPHRPPVSVILGSRVVRIASQKAGSKTSKTCAAEVVCEDGSSYPADIVISAVHPYDLGLLLRSSAAPESPNCMLNACSAFKEGCGSRTEEEGVRVYGQGSSSTARSGVSTMASILLSLPCASWITVHAFGAHSSRRADSLGRGCLYALDQLQPFNQEGSQPQHLFSVQQQPNEGLQEDMRRASTGIDEAIRAAKASVKVAELQLPGNLFPHAQAAALSASGLFESAAAAWVTKAAMLHAQAFVRVYQIESLMEKMQRLLLPLQQLLQPRNSTSEQNGDGEENRAACMRAFGLLVAVAEDAVVRLLLREGITKAEDKLVLCSRLALQAEPQWPLTLQQISGVQTAERRQGLLGLLRTFEKIREEEWSGSPAFHSVFSKVPKTTTRTTKSSFCPSLGKQEVNEETMEALEGNPQMPAKFADARFLFHKLRVENTPWLQVVGPSGCFSEWGAGARVKDAAIFAHQIATRFASFPDTTPEVPADFISRLNGGWLEKPREE